MGNGFWLAFGQMCQMCFWTVRYLPRGDWKQLPRRTLMFGLTIPVLLIFQVLHWIGFAFDELLFRKYRSVDVMKPIFVTGIPRSGTTHLQRVLANHDSVTCMQTWECALAPSISERYFYRAIGGLLKPVRNLLNKKPIPFLNKMSAIHELGLTEAEEDFIALLPINACFLLVVLFPARNDYWRLANFDSAMPAERKKTILKFYHRMLQKHLYFHGDDKRYLCKNPSFMTWVHSLSNQYDDASFIICEREPAKTVPSQLSSLKPTWDAFYGQPMNDSFSKKIVTMLADYYHYLEKLPLNEVNAMRLPMSELVSDLTGSIQRVMSHCELDETIAFQTALTSDQEKAKNYKSSHQYQAHDLFDWSLFQTKFPKSALTFSTEEGLSS